MIRAFPTFSSICVALFLGSAAAAPDSACTEVASPVPDSAPRAIRLYAPRYTKKALKDKSEGKVQVTFDVNANGEVENAKVASGLGNELDQTALEAILLSPFYPGYKDGKPVAMHARYTFDVKVPKNGATADKPIAEDQVIAMRKERDSRAASLTDTAPNAECPRVKYRVDPMMTEEAKDKKYKGNVTVSLIVNEDGTPADVKVTEPAGMGLDEPALLSVLRWRFYPAMRDGKAIRTRTTVTVSFRTT